MMKRPKKNGLEPVNEHNQTTEAFDYSVSPYAPTVTGNQPPRDTPPLAMTHPGAQQQVPVQPPLIGAYPFLPPAPARQNESLVPKGGIATSSSQNVAPSLVGNRKLRRIFPSLVGLCFVAVQILLLADFALTTLGKWNTTVWVNVIYVVSAVFIWPVQMLVHLLPTPLSIPASIVTLLAILLYGMLSRVVVRSLKLLLHPRRV